MTSTLKADVLTAKTTDGAISIKGDGTGKVSLGDANLLWPDADGSSSGDVLQTNASGVLSFAAVASGPSADYFHVHPNTNQSVPSGVHTLISMQTEVADTANIYDTTNYRVVIPNGEVWVLFGAASYENNATTTAAGDYARAMLHIRRNGTTYTAATCNSENTAYANPQITTVVTGNGSDYYDTALYQYNVPNPGSVYLSGSIYATYFMGWRIR